jgi:hypothetical protein
MHEQVCIYLHNTSNMFWSASTTYREIYVKWKLLSANNMVNMHALTKTDTAIQELKPKE